jgi:hypothetical protein
MKANSTESQRAVPEPNHQITLGNVRDPEMRRKSAEIDAAKDREWFRRNPNADEYEREASLRELLTFGYPSGTRVHVKRGPMGSQLRVFLLPKHRTASS